ncbi:hypothetical protein FPV67DRAFT_1443658 [Lyophyllum atratum]|nr:hypothetical protein FPV67DRAFT_1443658 [Lyophyllum atratum]
MYTTRSAEATPQVGSAIPVAAIAGGIIAGTLLAIAICMAWVHWGKSLKRARIHHWKEVPLFASPMDRKVKFAGSYETGKASTSNLPQGNDAPPFDKIPEVSKPRPLRSAKRSSHLSSPSGVRGTTHSPGDFASRSSRVTHKPSTVSSSSVYSTASGEEHQVRVPPNLILAATGDLSMTSGGGERRSVASSSWSFLSRMAHGVQENIYRYSQVSSRSAYTVDSRDSSGAPIGMAL